MLLSQKNPQKTTTIMKISSLRYFVKSHEIFHLSQKRNTAKISSILTHICHWYFFLNSHRQWQQQNHICLHIILLDNHLWWQKKSMYFLTIQPISPKWRTETLMQILKHLCKYFVSDFSSVSNFFFSMTLFRNFYTLPWENDFGARKICGTLEYIMSPRFFSGLGFLGFFVSEIKSYRI